MFTLRGRELVSRTVQILLISLLVFILSVAPIGFGASHDTVSLSKNGATSISSPVKKTQQLPAGAIDGAVNPEMIPDRIAYILLFRVLDLPEEATDLEKERAISFAENVGVKGQNIDQLLAVTREFRRQVSKLDKQVAEIKDRSWPNPSPEVMEQLGELQREKETITDTLVASLPSQLGSDGHWSLHMRVNDHVKRRIKLVPTQPPPAKPHHASFHSQDMQPITLASLNLPAHSYLASSRPFAQGMGYGATYSDQWINSSWTRIWGCGATEDYYNGYGHQYYVRTTLTSPMGRTASATSYTSSSYARVDIRLDWPWEDSDLGEYVASTEHWTLCPYIGFWIAMNNTQKKAYYGISVACYRFRSIWDDQYGRTWCDYGPVEGCNCKCWSRDGRSFIQQPGKYCGANPWLQEG